MIKKNNKSINMTIDKLAIMVAKGFENTATKEDLLKIQIQTNGIESDLKSFKQETKNSLKEVNEKLDDISETVKFYDKRIEKLEEKI